ncbi:hypothetical protein FGB62_36g10 [Gracilaria domingensis]|nr:hypothetical protein FGB62_36g10 [Gracilaria domingensis]
MRAANGGRDPGAQGRSWSLLHSLGSPVVAAPLRRWRQLAKLGFKTQKRRGEVAKSGLEATKPGSETATSSDQATKAQETLGSAAEELVNGWPTRGTGMVGDILRQGDLDVVRTQWAPPMCLVCISRCTGVNGLASPMKA